MQALSEAWTEDGPDSGSPAPVAEAPSEGATPESNQEAEKPSGLFYDVDPNTLTPELRKVFDGMQSAFTQKSQEIAETRKRYESLGDYEQVEQAVGFVQSLNNPENLVQLHSELSEYLQQAGYTKADADAAATSAIQEQQTEAQETDYGFDDPQVAQLKSEVDQLREWRQEFEAQQEQSRIEAAIERTELQLRQDRNYTDDDVSRLYQLAYAHGGDLVAAADAYDAWKNDLIGAYVNTKAESVTAVSPVGRVMGQEPQSFGSDFEAAHKYAKRLAIAAQAAGDLAD